MKKKRFSSVKPELKVMSFNLRHIIKEEFFGVWKTRYRRIIDFIDSESPDIIGVQELTRKGKRYLKHNLKDYKIVGKRRHSIIFTNEYNCVLVKKDFKIKGHKTYSLSDKINILSTNFNKFQNDNVNVIQMLSIQEEKINSIDFMNEEIKKLKMKFNEIASFFEDKNEEEKFTKEFLSSVRIK